MKKISDCGWTTPIWALMLSTSCFAVLVFPLFGAEQPGSGQAVEVREAQIARQAAEQRCAELAVQLVRTERDLEKERQRNAELLLQARRLQETVDQYNLRVAGLLTDQGSADTAQAMAKAVAALETRQGVQQQLCGKVREFKAYMASVLETLRPSEALKKEILGRYAELTKACDRLELLPPLVAGRGGEVRTPKECRILSVETEQGIVALDAGMDAGIRPGMTWRVFDGDRQVAKLQVVEVRPTLSAATVLEGSVHRLAAGLPARPGEP